MDAEADWWLDREGSILREQLSPPLMESGDGEGSQCQQMETCIGASDVGSVSRQDDRVVARPSGIEGQRHTPFL